MKCLRLLGILALCMTVFTACEAAEELMAPEELRIKNPSFEQGSTYWTIDNGSYDIAVDTFVGHLSSSSLKIRGDKNGFYQIPVITSAPIAGLEEYSYYEITFWLKTSMDEFSEFSELSDYCVLSVTSGSLKEEIGNEGLFAINEYSDDWKKHSIIFTTGNDVSKVELYITMLLIQTSVDDSTEPVAYNNIAWIDDFQIVKVN